MDNLFINLEKFGTSEKKKRHEEFFTQLVTFVLKNDKQLLKQFIEWIMPTERFVDSDCHIEPETWIKGSRLDIKIEQNKDFVIIIENKMGARIRRGKKKKQDETSTKISEEELDQLNKYANWLSNQEHKHKKLVLISNPCLDYVNDVKQIENEGKDFEHKSWTEFHNLISKYVEDRLKTDNNFYNNKAGFLLTQLKEYMEDENMSSWQSIKKENDKDINNMWKTYNQFNKILEDLSSVFIDKLDCKLEDKEDSLVNDSCPSIYKGLKTNKRGIRVTFGFDAEDKEEGKKFSFVIEIDEAEKGCFTKLKLRLSEDIKIKSDDGEDYLEIGYPLNDVFYNKSHIEQKKELEDYIKKKLKELIDLKVFT